MNLCLFYTSCIMLVLHAIKCIDTMKTSHIVIFMLGCCCSVLNHGTNNRYLQLLDRFIMTLCFLVEIFIRTAVIWLILSVIFFVIAKVVKSTMIHICAHAMITYFHLIQ